MPYCSVEEAWGKNFKNLTKPRKKITTPPRPMIENYKIEEGMVGSADTTAYASFKMSDKSRARKARYNNSMEPLEFQRGMGVKRLEADIDTGGPITDSFLEDLYGKKVNKDARGEGGVPTPYSLLNSSGANLVSDEHLQHSYKKYVDYIAKLEKRIEHLEDALKRERAKTPNSGIYNLIIYVFSGIFIIFLLDTFVRLGKCVGNGGFGGSLSLKRVPDIREYMPRPREMFRGGAPPTFVPNRFFYNYN